MVIRVASILLRLCGTLALILGLLFWNRSALNLIGIHMLLGLLVVVSLWVIGVGQAFSPGGSWPFAIGALLFGVLVAVVGMRQTSLLPGSFHWVIQVIHLLLGVLAMGIGQAGVARSQKGVAVREEALRSPA
ncbi:MAG TPA: hypothetical protein VFS21_23905 [Roseiflexaceae bacterium]|nr:hypothetical protein [Roseiflexaceae bacterium]